MRTVYKHILATVALLLFGAVSAVAQLSLASFGSNGLFTPGVPDQLSGCNLSIPTYTVMAIGGSGNYVGVVTNVVSLDGGYDVIEGVHYSVVSTGPTTLLMMTGLDANKNYLFTVTVTDLGTSISLSKTVMANIGAAPKVEIENLGPIEFCRGGVVTLRDKELDPNTISYRWLNSANENISGEVLSSIEIRESGRYKLVASSSNEYTCERTSNQIEVKVKELPVVSLSIDPVCDGAEINLKAEVTTATEGDYTFNWSGPNSYNGSVTGSNLKETAKVVGAQHPLNSGEYSVKVTDKNGCEATASASITVSAPMNEGEIDINITSVCKGETMNITLSSVIPPSGGHNPSYQWQMQEEGGTWIDIAGATDLGGWTGDITFNKTTKFRRHFHTDCGDMISNEVTVTVVAPAVLDPGGPYEVCAGETVTLHGSIVSGATKGTWKGGKGTWENKTTLDGATYTPDKSEYGKTIQLTLATTDAGSPCGNQSVKVDLVVAEEITLSFADEEVCINDAPFTPSVSANVAGGTGTLVTVDFNVASPFDPSAYAGMGPQRFKYQYTVGSCTVEQEFTITVISPQVFNITTLSPVTYCFSGDGVTINLDGSESGVTYTVYKDGVATTHTLAGNGGALVFSGIKGAGVYTIKAVDAKGCEIFMTGSVTLTEVSDIAGNVIVADQTICSGSDATPLTGPEPTGGNGTYIYQWQSSTDGTNWTDISGANSQNYDPGKVSAKTYYQRYVTSGACDNTSTPVTISVTTPIQNNTIGADQTICYGAVPSGFTGTVATSSGGTVSYTWHETADGTTPGLSVGTGQNLDLSTPLTATTQYIRVATDGGACPDDVSTPITVTVAAELKVNIINPKEPKCGGGSDGSLEADASGGLGDYTYTWTGDKTGTGKTFTGLKAGSYTVTVTASGCDASTTATDSYMLGEPTLVTGTPTPKDVTLCFGNNNGEISVTASGGTGPYTFTLGADVQNGTSANFTGLTAGDHTIYIEDANGCSGMATPTINQPNELLMGTHDLVNPSCVGNADGQITVNATGGTGALTYTLNGGTPTPVGTPTPGLAADSYAIVVTDVNGCTKTGSVVLNDPTPVTLTATGIDVTGCPGSPTGGIALTPAGGTGTYEYYSDQLGSTWTAVPAGNEINGLAAGNYTVKVRDANLCESAEQTVTVTESNALEFTATPNSVLCHNSTDGKIEVSGIAGGTGSNYQLFIDDNGGGVHDGTVPYDVTGTSHVFGSLAPATYTITLTDGVCNSLPKDVTIVAPPAITLTLDEVGKIICFNGFEPKATVKFTVNGGTGELKYHFSGLKTYSGKAEKGMQTVAEVGLGTFELTIEDASGCKITHPNPIEVTMGDAFRLETTHPIVKETSCAELTDGSATARVRGGSGLYYYELVRLTPPISEVRYPDFGGTAEKEVIFAGLAKGEYQIRAYDMNVVGGCVQVSERFEVNGPEAVNFTENFEPIRCNGGDATFTVEATGGTGEYVIELYNGSTLVETKIGSGPAVFTINVEGDYHATVKDTKNCGNHTTSTYSVVNPAKVQFAATNAGNVTCAGGKNGIIRISGLTGGNGEYWYSLSGADRVRVDDPSVDVDVKVGADTWLVEVYDGNGCPADPASYSIDITEPAPLKIEYKFDNPLCSTTGELKAKLKGGSGSYQVSVDNSVWTDIVGNEYSFGSVSGGTYTLYVRDALDHDCSVPHDTTFETPKALQLDVPLTLEQSPSCQQIGRLVVKTSGGMATVQYKLYKEGVPLPVQENGTGIFEVKDGGDYYVEITDGCSTIQSPAGTDRVHIDQVPYVTINGVNIVESIKCKGDFARIEVDATGGTGELYYALWNNSVNPAELIQENAAGDNIFSNIKANTDYMIIVRDGYGCRDTSLLVMDEPEAMLEWSSYVRPVPPTNLGKTDGYIHFKVKGGEAPYTVTFTPEGGTPQTVTETDSMIMFVFDNLGANVYRVNVTDGRGCTLDTSFVLQPMYVKHWGQHVSCFGANDGKVYAVITGNPPYELMLRDMKNLTVTYTDFVFESNTKLAPTGIQDTFVFSGIPAGEYNLYVGDRNSIGLISYNADIFEPGELQASIVEEIPPICAMGGTGAVKIDVSGSRTYDKSHIDVVGTEPTYVVKWQNETTGETGEEQTNSEGTITVSGLNPGVIKFTVTTNRGCGPVEREVDFPIIEPIVVTTNVLQESSYGAGNGLIEANATGDNPIVTYHLLDKDGNLVETSAIGLFSNVSEGKYVVKAEDDLTCPGYSDTIYIRGTDVVVDDITPVTCFGENQGAFKFHIEHGFPRFKSVSVADASGNTVAIAPEMALYSCNEPITAENLLAGDYTITIVDSLDNPITHTVTIGEPDKLIIDATLTAPDCASNGSIALTVVGGVAPYTMEWAIDEGALEPLSSSTIDIVQGGTYRVVVTDANNCSTEWSQFVAPAESITLALEEVSNPTCFGGDNGRIAVEAANDGSSMYQYLLEKDGTLINITDNGVFENLSKGDYKVVVQNINTGCSQSFSYTLVDGAEAINIAFDGFIGKLNCPSDADGYATAVVTGGSGSYTYVWPQLGESTSSVSGLTPGTYEVIVADDLGCTATASYTIDGPKPFVFDKATRTEAKCRNSAIPANLGGKLSVGLVEGGTAPYSFYLVDETNHSIREGQPNFTGLGAGIYEVWVEDANGCRDMYYDTVLISPINDFEIGAMDTTVCFTNEVELKANVILGDVYSGQPLKYSWWSEANAANVSPDATGETYPLEGLDVNVYRYKLRVSQEGGDRCYVEKWFDVGVYPKIDIHVPLYVSSVQNDTILSILFNQEYNVDVSTSTFDYNTSFEWKPSGVFTRGNSWNSSIFMTPEKYEELKQTYPHRFKTLRDPQTKRDGDFFLVDVVATTDVGCQDSLTLYTKIVNKLYLANVFSPNGDGRNDIWKLPKEYLFPDLEIEIFNRWGALVWSAAGDKAARGWDGRTNNGKVLPIGTYWYVIKFNINSSEWKPLTGSVTIVK